MVLGDNSSCNMCPDIFPGCCSGGHRNSRNASILTCVCTTRPSRTWSMCVGMFHRPLLILVPNMWRNPSICSKRFPLAYNATPFKWPKLLKRSTYSSAGHVVYYNECSKHCSPLKAPQLLSSSSFFISEVTN